MDKIIKGIEKKVKKDGKQELKKINYLLKADHKQDRKVDMMEKEVKKKKKKMC